MSRQKVVHGLLGSVQIGGIVDLVLAANLINDAGAVGPLAEPTLSLALKIVNYGTEHCFAVCFLLVHRIDLCFILLYHLIKSHGIKLASGVKANLID